MDREIDLQRIEDVHARFDYFGDKNRMENKIKDERFDLTKEMPDTQDEAFSTEFEEEDIEPADTEIYRQYRLMQREKKLE